MQQALSALGVPKNEIYARDKKYAQYTGGRTIYDRLPAWKIDDMIKHYHRERVREAHPDKGGSDELCAYYNYAADRARTILKNRGLLQ